MRIFVWCRGQDDNIGDVILRRRVLDMLRPWGELHIYTGPASDGFFEGLAVQSADVSYISSGKWLATMTATALRARTVLIFNPGEIRPDRKSMVANIAILPPQILIKARGGYSARVGVSVLGDRSPTALPIMLTNRLCDLVSWRDTMTPNSFGKGLVCPDWAFDELRYSEALNTVAESRTELALTLRGDRPPPSPEYLDAYVTAARALNLNPHLFVQVRRDNDRMTSISEQYGLDLLTWPTDVDHKEQELKVRMLMHSSAAVVSDRLHALVMGVTEGAQPLGIVPHPESKLKRHFDAAGVDAHCFATSEIAQDDIELVFLRAMKAGRDLAAFTKAADSVKSLERMVVGSIEELVG